MATGNVYGPTTTPHVKTSVFLFPSKTLEKIRLLVKVGEVLFSLVAFILEEVVDSCVSCSSLYFFEFVSCTAFLFTLLLLILLYTNLRNKVGITCWPKVDFAYTVLIALLFIIASIVFTTSNGDMSVERSAVAFGFLASILFLVDAAIFCWTHGFPFKTDGNSAATNGVAPPQPEAEARQPMTEPGATD